MIRRILAVLLLVGLIFCMLTGVNAAGELFFVGVNNDIPVLLSGDTAPFYAGGVLYAPHTVFSAAPGGVNVSYDVEKETFALFTLSNTLVYDLAEGTMTDKSGNTVRVEVIYRNGTLYLPVEQAARQFGLAVSLSISMSGCSVLRFKDGTEVYDDQTFLEKSELFISHMLDMYGSQELGNDAISDNETEDGPDGEEEPAGAAAVYLAFVGDAVSQATLGHLEAMEYVAGTEIYATFFLTEDQIRENPNLIRDIYNNGHTIGVTVSYAETDNQMALKKTNDALDDALYIRSVLALLSQDANVTGYSVVSTGQAYTTVEDALAHGEDAPFLLCSNDVAATLEQLSVMGISILQIWETTTLPERIIFEP